MKAIIILSVVLLMGCGVSVKYTVTDEGLISYSSTYCTFGVLTNNSRVSILGADGKPILCSGYIKLTAAEKMVYEQK